LHLISEKDSLIKALKEFQTGYWSASLSVQVGQRNTDSQFYNDDVVDDTKMFFLDQNALAMQDTTVNLDDNCVVIYEFELRNLDLAFKNSSYGLTIMRGLHSIWLKYCSDIVRKVDKSISNPNTIMQTGKSRSTDSMFLKKKGSGNDLITQIEGDVTLTSLRENVNVGRCMSPKK